MVGFWALAALWVTQALPLAGRSVVPYIACFLPGVIAFAIGARQPTQAPSWTWGVILAGLAALDFTLPEVPSTQWLVCLLLGLAIPCVQDVRTRWLQRGAQQIAQYSYGIYLLHLLALWAVPGHLRGWPVAVQAVAYLATLVALSWLGYRYVEQPGIRIGARLARRWSERQTAHARVTPAEVPLPGRGSA